jgi:DNA-directed RNA polymerase subunit RPC12/RpoP
MQVVTTLLAIATGLLGLVFLVGSQGQVHRLVVGVILLAAALALVVLPRLRPRRVEVIQRIDLPPESTMKGFTCRSCGAPLSPPDLLVKDGTPGARCPHCGAEFEVQEPPRW